MPNEQNTPRCRSRESRARTRKSEPKTKEGGALEITVDRVSCTSSSRERAADKIRKKGEGGSTLALSPYRIRRSLLPGRGGPARAQARESFARLTAREVVKPELETEALTREYIGGGGGAVADRGIYSRLLIFSPLCTYGRI